MDAQAIIAIFGLMVLGFMVFVIYFILKILQFVIQATNLYKKMVTRQDMMIKLLKDIRGGGNPQNNNDISIMSGDINECQKCGASVTDDSSSPYCGNCGAKLL